MKIPSFFKVRTAQESREHFRLDHSNQTTTDFFRLKPSMIREMVPQDKFTAHVESLCRFLPMPLPTYGSINFANRAFFVPARQLMEGFNEFLEGTPYRNGAGTYNITHVPQIANSTFADYIKDLSAPFYKLMIVTLDVSKVYGGKVIVFLDQQGRALKISTTASSTQGGSPILLTYALSSGVFTIQAYGSSVEEEIEGALELFMSQNFGVSILNYVNVGDYNVSTAGQLTLSELGEHLFGDPDVYETYHPVAGNSAFKLVLNVQEFQPLELDSYSIQHYDFLFGIVAYKFNKLGKNVYDLLKNLGYSVDFSSALSSGVPVWSNTQYVSAMQLLAYFRVYLDYYLDPQYYGTLQSKYAVFFGVNKTVSKSELSNIVDMLVVNYDRDYFTAAWQNPSGPNPTSEVTFSSPSFVDINALDPTSQNVNEVKPYGGTYYYDNTPQIKRNGTTGNLSSITQYTIDALKMLSDYMHRHQLAGYRAFDRFFAEFGVKLSDDRAGRCYFLDSQNYSTTVKDIMSTAATQDASLGDYAGKAVAYSGKKSITYEADEFGYFIIMSSCTPTVGYVQGTKRENFHLSRYDFHRGQFDNLGVQPIRKDELFADYGLSSFDGQGIVSYPSNWSPDGVFGFSPRYAEYKVGSDILSGDFIIPSRRAGLDAFHLYRLFSGREAINLGQSFVTGDQAQYDRIFNDTSDEYDHIYQVHSIVIDALRPMKSITEVICFDDDHGRDVEIPANGTMLN